MPVKVEAWKCQWCNMTSVYRGNVARHEARSCPNHKSCQLCRFFDVSWDTIYNPYHGGEPGSTDYEVKNETCCRDDKAIPMAGKVSNCPYFEAGAGAEEAMRDGT